MYGNRSLDIAKSRYHIHLHSSGAISKDYTLGPYTDKHAETTTYEFPMPNSFNIDPKFQTAAVHLRSLVFLAKPSEASSGDDIPEQYTTDTYLASSHPAVEQPDHPEVSASLTDSPAYGGPARYFPSSPVTLGGTTGNLKWSAPSSPFQINLIPTDGVESGFGTDFPNAGSIAYWNGQRWTEQDEYLVKWDNDAKDFDHWFAELESLNSGSDDPYIFASPGTDLSKTDALTTAITGAVATEGMPSGLLATAFLIGLTRRTASGQEPVTMTMDDPDDAPWVSDQQTASYSKWASADAWKQGGDGTRVALMGPTHPSAQSSLFMLTTNADPNNMASFTVSGNSQSHWDGTYTVDGQWEWGGTAFVPTQSGGNLLFRRVDGDGNVYLVWWNTADNHWNISRVNQVDATPYVQFANYATLAHGAVHGELSDDYTDMVGWGKAPATPNHGGTITHDAPTLQPIKTNGAVFYRKKKTATPMDDGNWVDGDQYSLKVDLASEQVGGMDVWTYGADPATQPVMTPNTNWTITGYNHTVLRGTAQYSAADDTTRLYLQTNDDGLPQYTPFVPSTFAPPANAQEAFTGPTVNCQVLYYSFSGQYWNLQPGATLTPHLVTSTNPNFQSPDIALLHVAVQQSNSNLQQLISTVDNGTEDGSEGEGDADAFDPAPMYRVYLNNTSMPNNIETGYNYNDNTRFSAQTKLLGNYPMVRSDTTTAPKGASYLSHGDVATQGTLISSSFMSNTISVSLESYNDILNSGINRVDDNWFMTLEVQLLCNQTEGCDTVN